MDGDRQHDEFNPAYWVWGATAKKPRLLHTMLRVRDLEQSLNFYCDALGMRVLDRYDFTAGRFSIVFIAYESYDAGGAIELTWNWDQADNYTLGNAYGHIAIGMPDLDGTVDRLERQGVPVTVKPKRQAPGAPRLAFVRDPDGYAVELIQTSRM